MMKIKTLLILFCLHHGIESYLEPIEYRLPLEGNRPAPGSPWPLPQVWNRSNDLLTIDPKNFRFETNMGLCDIIRNGMKRYRDLIFIDQEGIRANNIPLLEFVYIEIENFHDCGYPQHEQDESYNIEIIRGAPGKISARTVWGALRGLETFSQLVFQNVPRREFLINVTHIRDWPRYSFRAILLDSARHFQPKNVILANLDAMAYNKLNVFHWHLVDDQSFPFESKQFPELTKQAYSPLHVYTQKDVADIIEYARMRGIRVVPELDTPGHTHAIGRAFPDLLTPCYGKNGQPGTPNYTEFSAYEILNPMRNQTYEFMKLLFQEFRRVFPDDYLHLGMDEVYYACWRSSPEIKDFMNSRGMKELHQVEQYYIERTLQNVKDIGYKYMMYQDPADNGVKLANDSIVIVWKDKSLDSSMDLWQNYIKNISKAGLQIVLSACWYLNYINYPYPGYDWEKYYLCDPRHFNGTEIEKNLVVGGEACMWGEFVDATNLLSRLWPRASAVAERLWSDANATQDVDTARHRLDQHRCRMVFRGIPAAPILNGFCDFDWKVNVDEPPVDAGDRIRLKN